MLTNNRTYTVRADESTAKLLTTNRTYTVPNQ
jgi:hypothetical protein